jgi:hypothetical protein
MSGTTDTSTAAQRIAFSTLVEGSGGAALTATAAAVSNCSLPMPLTTALLLGLPPSATFAQGATLLQFRWANGQAGL